MVLNRDIDRANLRFFRIEYNIGGAQWKGSVWLPDLKAADDLENYLIDILNR